VSTGRFVALEPRKRIVQVVEFESGNASFAGLRSSLEKLARFL